MSFHLFTKSDVSHMDAPPDMLLEGRTFGWWAISRAYFTQHTEELQQRLQDLGLSEIVDVHVEDLQNSFQRSSYDYTSDYDVITFRRLSMQETNRPHAPLEVFQHLDTKSVGMLIYDNLLLTVHEDMAGAERDFINRYAISGQRLAASPADLMLRLVNFMVDGYLELRRPITSAIDEWQRLLLDDVDEFDDWSELLQTRNDLRDLDEICEEQHDAMQEWLDSMQEQATLHLSKQTKAERLRRDLLIARSRDVIEHIGRVERHLERMEKAIDNATQIHFSVQGHKTNEFMRALTVVTAIFLPLTLVTGFFGMNFEGMPLIGSTLGFWVVSGLMLLVALGLFVYFWRRKVFTGVH